MSRKIGGVYQMRKIDWSCADAQVQHALAVLAITQAGMTRGFRSSEGIHHQVAWDDGDLRGHGGHYFIVHNGEHAVTCHTESALGCWVEWHFTWPDLKLLSMNLRMCEHTGYELDPSYMPPA